MKGKNILCRFGHLGFVIKFVSLLVLVCASGCSQRELCYDHSHASPVTVIFDWSNAPEAAPETMVVWFFSVDTDESYRFELTDGQGQESRSGFDCKIKVRPGTYRVLCHNGGAEYIIEQGQNADDYRLVTPDDEVLAPMNRSESAPLPGAIANQPVRKQPDTLWAHTLDTPVTVLPSDDTEKQILFTPVEVTAVYDITITGVKNLTSGVDASAVITGMAEAWHPLTSRPAGEEATIPFALNHAGADCLKGSVVVFGDNTPHNVRHYLRVYTSYKYYYDYDVTDQIHNASDSRHVEINLNGLNLPATGEGMSPGVNDWDNAEEVDLLM